MHARQQLREAVKTAVTGLPITGTHVETGRTRPLPEGHPQTLLVYTKPENSDVDAQGEDATLMRDLRLVVEIRVTAAEPPDDELDLIATDVEAALATNAAVLAMVREITLIRSDPQVTAEGASHIGRLALEYRVVYRTRESDPTTIV
ncbi:hypothetical protein RA307_31685 [Xanthobacteraceae bacterium Astr-EGSB]|uniref:hypothetical protein n=1 Tax=Astrobacterium formosum TaxID=3069710 RepID=UPI0027B1193B|nr:hypothetical protein [Xanthobacteraceae bacterium Astr-EGSB]